MLFKVILPSLLTAAVMAVPTPDPEPLSLDDAHGEMKKFKRDSILDARDLELAEIHGVNLTEMYKHSLIERDDGDHIVIWVDRQLVDDDDEEDLIKRQKTRLAKGSNFATDSPSDWCRDHKRQDHTGPNGPYTGGINAIYRWARGHSGGAFKINGRGWQNLIVAGSNSGANALYRARVPGGGPAATGTQDVRNDADWTANKRRKFGSSWRASSKGGETCQITTRINYELIRTKYNV